MASQGVPSPSSGDEDRETLGTKDIPGADMNDEGEMPMPKRRGKRNGNKRDD